MGGKEGPRRPTTLPTVARILAGLLAALKVAMTALATWEWLSASEGLGRGIGLTLVCVSMAAFCLSGPPAMVLVARNRRPVLALLLGLAFPDLWAAFMSIA